MLLQGDRRDLGGEGEDDVEVLRVQQLAAPGGEPGVAGRRLALGTVPFAAGAVADAAAPAAVALLNLAPESGRAAQLDGAHDAPLEVRQSRAAAVAEGLPVAPEDVLDLEPWASPRSLAAAGGTAAGRAGWSRGSRLKVAGGGDGAAVAQQPDRAHVHARLEQMDGESMPLVPSPGLFGVGFEASREDHCVQYVASD